MPPFRTRTEHALNPAPRASSPLARVAHISPAEDGVVSALFCFFVYLFSYSQGAVQCLRNVSQGLAGVVYGQIFSLGVSTRVEKALGFVLPGLPLFCASGCGVTGLAVSPAGRGTTLVLFVDATITQWWAETAAVGCGGSTLYVVCVALRQEIRSLGLVSFTLCLRIFFRRADRVVRPAQGRRRWCGGP